VTLAELLGADAAAEITSQAHLELELLLERHRRRRLRDAAAPKDDGQKQDGGDEPRPAR
jgi:hypothetical protein